jgi:hypothetical protein
MRSFGAFKVKKFWLSGMSPVAADLASAARAVPPSGAAEPPVEADELDWVVLLLEALPQPLTPSTAARIRDDAVLLGTRRRLAQAT